MNSFLDLPHLPLIPDQYWSEFPPAKQKLSRYYTKWWRRLFGVRMTIAVYCWVPIHQRAPKCLILECFILALPPILVLLASLGCQRDAPEVTWLRLSGCLRVAFSAPSGLLRTASAGRHGTGRERRSVCACVQVEPQQSCDNACLVYLLQAAAVSQTDQGHAQLFTDSVQLGLGLLRQSAGGLIQDWEN